MPDQPAPSDPSPTSSTSTVLASQRALHRVVLGATLVLVVLSCARAVVVGGSADVFVWSVALHAVLVTAAAAVSRAVRPGLRVDTLSLCLAWECFRGCGVPVILQYVGSGDRFWYRLGTTEDAFRVLLLGNASFAVLIGARAIAGAVDVAVRRRRSRAEHPSPVTPLVVSVAPTTLIVLGLVGLLLRFPTVDAVTGFLSGRIEDLQGNPLFGEGPLAYLSIALRPLLPMGVGLLVLGRRRAGRPWAWMLVPLAASLVFALGSYGLNRAAPAFALMVFGLVHLERSRRTTTVRSVVAVVAALGALFVGVGTLRQTLWIERTGLDVPQVGVVPVLQSLLAYGATPMQLAPVLPVHATSNPFTLHSWLQSFVSPVPGFADPARFENSTAIFNYVIYDEISGRDQLLPEWFHEWLVFGIPGLVVAAVVVGLLFGVADAARRRAQTLLGSYAATMASMWIAQLGVTSVSVVEQNLFNFVLAPALLGALHHLRPRRGESTPTVGGVLSPTWTRAV